MISKCGVICAQDCRAFGSECEGCNELEGRVSWAQLASRAVRVALVPADRHILAPPPGCISMLWMTMPVGIRARGRQFPTFVSASGPVTTVMQEVNTSVAMM